MEVRIANFHGYGAREAKLAVFRHFSNYPRRFWHFEHGLDELTGEAYWRGSYLSQAWTGRCERVRRSWRTISLARLLWNAVAHTICRHDWHWNGSVCNRCGCSYEDIADFEWRLFLYPRWGR